jgi:hypothetical protein
MLLWLSITDPLLANRCPFLGLAIAKIAKANLPKQLPTDTILPPKIVRREKNFFSRRVNCQDFYGW